MKRARIIYNPTSGREIIKRNLPEVMDKLEMAGYETSCHATKGSGDAAKAASEACDRHFDLIVAAGGDGTLNEVVSGISGKKERPKLGLIPVGTTNDYARALQIPRDILAATDIIVNGASVPIDVGRYNDKYFINIAGGGRLTELTYDVPVKLKTVLGQLAYYLKGIEMLPSLKATKIRVEYDGGVFEGEALLFLIMLTNSVGGFENLAPDASINDGYFTLIIVKKTNLAEFIRLATLALRGEHMNEPNVIYVKTKAIRVTSPEEVLINIDGELGGMTPAEFINLHRHLEIFAPVEQFPSEDRAIE